MIDCLSFLIFFLFLRCIVLTLQHRGRSEASCKGWQTDRRGLDGWWCTLFDGAPFVCKVCHIITIRHVVILYILSSDEDQGALHDQSIPLSDSFSTYASRVSTRETSVFQVSVSGDDAYGHNLSNAVSLWLFFCWKWIIILRTEFIDSIQTQTIKFVSSSRLWPMTQWLFGLGCVLHMFASKRFGHDSRFGRTVVGKLANLYAGMAPRFGE